jgi:YaaC-like protein
VTASLPAPLSGGSRVGALRWKDLYNPRRDLVWRHLRSLRHDPPGYAASGERRRVFASALEQAEELFTAGADIPYASRPILLFYGLSQAGRAIAAASTSATGNDWRLIGHGITVRNLGQGAPLAELMAIDAGIGSFTQLAPLLRSGSLPNGATTGELWATVPDLPGTPIAAQGKEYKNVLQLVEVGSGGGPETDGRSGMITAWIAGLPGRFVGTGNQAEIASYLAAYPTLAGSGPPKGSGTATEEAGGTARVYRVWWGTPASTGIDSFVTASTWPYRGDEERYVYPVLGGSNVPLNPLLAWWAILFVLSMLARYEPASWAKFLDVDSSSDAVRLEAILNEALDTCPQLILHAIRGVSR